MTCYFDVEVGDHLEESEYKEPVFDRPKTPKKLFRNPFEKVSAVDLDNNSAINLD